MFQSAFPYRIDDKGRLKMPAEFVSELGETFTIARALGRPEHLWLLPTAEWERVSSKLREQSLTDQRLHRWFIGTAVTTTLDGQGRLTIPPVLREYAGIQHEVMAVGVVSRVELWSKAKWDETEAEMSKELLDDLVRSAGL